MASEAWLRSFSATACATWSVVPAIVARATEPASSIGLSTGVDPGSFAMK